MGAAFNMPLNELEANVDRPKVVVALRDPESAESLIVSVQREMESDRFSVATLPPLRGGDF